MSFWVTLTFWFWTRREILDYCDIWNIWPSKSDLWHLNYSSNHQCSYIYLYVYLCWEVLRKCTEFNASCQEVRTPASFVSLYRWFGPTVSKTGERPVAPRCRSFQRVLQLQNGKLHIFVSESPHGPRPRLFKPEPGYLNQFQLIDASIFTGSGRAPVVF